MTIEDGAVTETVRVLLVDDDEDDYVITHQLLSDIDGQKLDVYWEASYDLALAAMRDNRHEIYLVDYHLGGRDGLELLKEAIRGGCDAPIILLTGQGDHEVDVMAMTAGAMDYLVKGHIDAVLLDRSIRYAIRRRWVEKQ